MGMMTLTVDAAAKPISLVPVRDAVAHIAAQMISGQRGEVQVLAADETRRFRSQELDLPAPVIVMFPGYVELDANETRYVSRRVVFARDNYKCQYCKFSADPGHARHELTLDHVKPAHMFASRGDATTWENVTTACRECNTKKAGHLPREVGMMPRHVPTKPHYVQLRFAGRLNEAQRNYITDYFGEKIGGLL